MRYRQFSCHVADVLSLGPSTAGMLSQVGVRTAGDLLAADARALSARLAGRIAAAQFAAWQQEAELLCTLPGISPCGARVLVQAGYGRREQVARATPIELLAAIEQVGSETLQHDARPTVADACGWIRECQAHRELRAA